LSEQPRFSGKTSLIGWNPAVLGGRLVLLLTLFWVPMVFVPQAIDYQNTISTQLKTTFFLWLSPLGLGLALAALCTRRTGGRLSWRLPLLIPVLLLTAWILARFSWTEYREAAWRDVQIWLACFSIALTAGWLGSSRKFRGAAWSLAILTGTLVSAYGMIQFYDYDVFDWGLFPWALPLRRVCASFGNPNFLGGYLVLTLPLTIASIAAGRKAGGRGLLFGSILLQVLLIVACVWRGGSPYIESLLERQGVAIADSIRLGSTLAQVGVLAMPLLLLVVPGRRRWTPLYPFCLALFYQLIALGLTFSLASMASVIAAVGLIALLIALSRLRKDRKDRRGWAMIAVLGVLVVLGLTASYPASRLVMQYRERTVLERAEMYRGALGMIADRPLQGFGPGMFSVYFPDYRPVQLAVYLSPSENFVDHAHNEYLELTSELGLIGLALFAWTIFSVLLPGLGSLLKGASSRKWWLEAALLAAIAGTLLQNVVSVNLRQVSTASLFWLCLGWLAGLARREVPGGMGPVPRSAWAKGALALLFLPVLAGGAVALRAWQGDLFLARSMKAFGQGQLREALFEARRAAELTPDRASTYYFLASLQYEFRDYEGALASYEKVRQLEREFVDVVFNQATVLAKLGRYDDARKIYESSLEKDPRNAKLYDYYARMLILNDRKDQAGEYRRKAIDLYREKLAFFPNDDRLHFNLGKNYMIDRQWTPAEEHLRRAIALDPRNALYRSTLEQLYTYRANPEMELK